MLLNKIAYNIGIDAEINDLALRIQPIRWEFRWGTSENPCEKTVSMGTSPEDMNLILQMINKFFNKEYRYSDRGLITEDSTDEINWFHLMPANGNKIYVWYGVFKYGTDLIRSIAKTYLTNSTEIPSEIRIRESDKIKFIYEDSSNEVIPDREGITYSYRKSPKQFKSTLENFNLFLGEDLVYTNRQGIHDRNNIKTGYCAFIYNDYASIFYAQYHKDKD